VLKIRVLFVKAPGHPPTVVRDARVPATGFIELAVLPAVRQILHPITSVGGELWEVQGSGVSPIPGVDFDVTVVPYQPLQNIAPA